MGYERWGVILDNVDMFRLIVPATTEVEPRPKPNEVISFVNFHAFGFGLPMHPLLKWLLYYYGIHLHNLTLRGSSTSASSSFCARPSWESIHIMCYGGFLFQVVCSAPGGSIILGWGAPRSNFVLDGRRAT
jgi:hypothetical protein